LWVLIMLLDVYWTMSTVANSATNKSAIPSIDEILPTPGLDLSSIRLNDKT